MRKRSSIALFLAMITSAFLWAEEPIISVSDFLVESANADYKFLGKGIAILVSGELRKSNQVKLIDREALNQILKEQEISVSDLADAQSQVKIGRLLSAQYLLVGRVVDMAGTLIVSVRLTDVSTAEIVWEDNLTAKVGAYDFIGAFFAKSLLGYFGAAVAATTVQKVEQQVEKKPEAIVALSQGVDALDRNDTAAAQTALNQAKALDPKNDAVAFYLSKLTVNTTKFQVTFDPWYTYQNPAYLGIIKTEKLYLAGSAPAWGLGGPTWEPHPYFNSGEIGNSNGDLISEFNAAMKLGYQFPFGERMGMSVDFILLAVDNRAFVRSGSDYNGISAGMAGLGSLVSLGWRVMDSICIGFGIAILGQKHDDSMPFGPMDSTAFAANAGVMYLNGNETFILDTRFGYGNGYINPLDPDTFLVLENVRYGVPLYNENTVTFALNEKRTFVVIKQINDIALDRPYYFGRLLGAFEQFFGNSLSLRLGLEGSFMLLEYTPGFGYGAVVGTTFRIIPQGIDFDVNLSYRMRPSYVIAGLQYPDFMLLFTVSWSNVRISRK
jgi:TolB-like protein